MLASIATNSLRGRLGWGPSYAVTAVKPDARLGLQQLAELIEAGKLKPTVKVYPLRDAAAAHAELQRGHTRGKLVLSVAQLDAAATS